MVGGRRIELLTSSVSRKRSPTELTALEDRPSIAKPPGVVKRFFRRGGSPLRVRPAALLLFDSANMRVLSYELGKGAYTHYRKERRYYMMTISRQNRMTADVIHVRPTAAFGGGTPYGDFLDRDTA